MQVEIVLLKFGNRTGVVFPPAVLKDLGFKAGQAMATTADGKITLSPKRKYTLAAPYVDETAYRSHLASQHHA